MTHLNHTHDPAARSWVDSANQPGCDFPLQNLPFAHAIDQQIRLTVYKNGSAHSIRPVIIMCQTAQAGLNATNDYWTIWIEFTQTITIDDCCSFRTESCPSPR